MAKIGSSKRKYAGPCKFPKDGERRRKTTKDDEIRKKINETYLHKSTIHKHKT